MRLVFFGSGAFGEPTLAALAQRHQIAAVVTQPDRPAGRGGKSTATPIAQFADAHLGAAGVPVWREENVNIPAVRERIRAVEADAWVVIAFGQYLSKALLEGVFAVNLHGSLLPRWRGAAPVAAAVLAGDAEAGNSVITLASRMDAGLVLGQTRRPLRPEYTAGDLHDLLSGDGPDAVLGVLADQAAGRVRGQEQDESLVTVAGKFTKADGWVDFGGSADECRRRIHGLNPWPGVTVQHRGAPLKLLRCAVERSGGGAAGTLADASAGVVHCGGGTALRLLEVQPAGKRAMPWTDYANGRRVESGERLEAGREPERAGGAC